MGNDLKEEQFLEYRSALIAMLRERPKTLDEEFGQNWQKVDGRSLDFDLRQKQIVYLETLTLADLRSFVSEKLRNAPACCVLVSAAAHEKTEPAVVPTVIGDRSWGPEDEAAFRCDAQWRYRPEEIDRKVG